MSKKRPRIQQPVLPVIELQDSKSTPAYWRQRLFQSRYSYKGKKASVKNWSVKIQHAGERHTLSLRPENPLAAATAACRLYHSIVKRGWSSVLKKPETVSAIGTAKASAVAPEKFKESHWAQKLIYRQHTVHIHPRARLELSVRIEHDRTAYYFPLQTEQRSIAARQALRIFKSVVEHGWEKTIARFPRELAIAFRWSDAPLAWTYTTIYTEINTNRLPARAARSTRPAPDDKLSVAVAESDADVRQALVFWLNRMEHFRCVQSFATATEALETIRSSDIQLLLVSQNLATQRGASFAEQLKRVAPRTGCLPFSPYEDSEELFGSTPGGSNVYLLKRTPPIHFLEPIESMVAQGKFAADRIAPEIWAYFKNAVVSLPVQSSDHALSTLTRREQEVLALLSKGFPDKEIADRLHISIWTVNGHVKNIFDKLNVHNRTEAVLKYFQK